MKSCSMRSLSSAGVRCTTRLPAFAANILMVVMQTYCRHIHTYIAPDHVRSPPHCRMCRALTLHPTPIPYLLFAGGSHVFCFRVRLKVCIPPTFRHRYSPPFAFVGHKACLHLIGSARYLLSTVYTYHGRASMLLKINLAVLVSPVPLRPPFPDIP